MAQGSRIYRLKLDLSDLDRGVYESLSLNLNLHPSESLSRLTARILAFALNYEEGLEFGRGLSTQEDATIWLRDANEHVVHWIEVGQVEPQRLTKLARRTDKTTLYCYGINSNRWWQQHSENLLGQERISVFGLPAEIIDSLSEALPARIEMQLVIQEGECQVFCQDQSWQFSPEAWLVNGHRPEAAG